MSKAPKKRAKARITKGDSLLLGLVILTGLYMFTGFCVPSAIVAVGPVIVGAIAFACFGYQAAQVADNWQRSAHYVPELDENTRCLSDEPRGALQEDK